jgi:predicted transcriptional regulator
MEKVMITLPNDLLEAVDLAARQRSESRSQFIRETLAERLEYLRRQAFEALLAEEYGFFAQETATIVEESLPAQATAAEKVWHWHE